MKKIVTNSIYATLVVVVFLGVALAIPTDVQADEDVSGLRHIVNVLLERVSALEEVLLPVDLTVLEQRISTLEAASQPISLTVNCPEDSLEEALAQVADRAGHVTITVTGFCEEEITVWRDKTKIQGAAPGDGLQSLILRAHRIELDQLTLIGGAQGIKATDGASFVASDLHISGANYGVSIEKNAIGNLHNVTVENSYIGVRATAGGVLRMSGGTIDTITDHGVEASFGGYVELQGVTVSNCEFGAIAAREGGSIDISNSIIEYNAAGGGAISGGHLTIHNDTIIRNNYGNGVGANVGGTVWLNSGVTITDNSGSGICGRAGGSINIGEVVIEYNLGGGIDLGGGAEVTLAGGTIIRNNTGNGIALGATSTATFFDDTVQITGNTGTAVICNTSGLDDVALIVGQPGIISGNGSDALQCPRGFP